MNRFAVPAIVVSVIVFAMAVGAYLLGLYLLPSQQEAVEKGTLAPWYIVWIMIAIVVVCAVSLGVFLLRVGIRGLSGAART